MNAPLRLSDHLAPDAPNRRADRRDVTRASIGLSAAGTLPVAAALTDVSAYGCCVETEATWLKPGRFVAITLPAGSPMESIVRWTRGSLAGLELLNPASANRADWLALID